MMKHVVPPIAAVDREETTKETELPGKQKILSYPLLKLKDHETEFCVQKLLRKNMA